jgi:hypothetical protein
VVGVNETGKNMKNMGPDDPIGQYLAQLRAGLRVAPDEAELILAEAEDHLRETAVAGLAAGLAEREAQEAAISSFGSVRAVVRAHDVSRGRIAVVVDLVMAAWKLGSLGLLAVGASGLVAAAMNLAFGRSFVGQAPSGTLYSAAACKYWMSIWPSAHSCVQAAVLENSSDAVSLRIAAGMAGVMLLALYVLARRFQRRRRLGRELLTTRLFPGLAMGCFAAIAVGLTLATVFGFSLGVPAGPGSYLSGAVAALAVAMGYGSRIWLAREARG